MVLQESDTIERLTLPGSVYTSIPNSLISCPPLFPPNLPILFSKEKTDSERMHSLPKVMKSKNGNQDPKLGLTLKTELHLVHNVISTRANKY